MTPTEAVLVTGASTGIGEAIVENFADNNIRVFAAVRDLSSVAEHPLVTAAKAADVKDGAVIIVDEVTGRLMPGRRWSDGLHQDVKAKEKVKIENETQTLATITLQNYFRQYKKLAGMTGTAETEAEEFFTLTSTALKTE